MIDRVLDPDAEVIALSPKALMASNRFLCEMCNKGFQREQNLQLHRRGHNLPWKLKQRSSKDIAMKKKKVYVCPEVSCVHHSPSRALGDLTGIKKHFSRKHGEKKYKCHKCSKKYAVQSDWKAHSKTCGTREYKCDCGTIFSRRDSFITHRAFCDALAEESAKAIINNTSILFSTQQIQQQQQLSPILNVISRAPSVDCNNNNNISDDNDGDLSLFKGDDQQLRQLQFIKMRSLPEYSSQSLWAAANHDHDHDQLIMSSSASALALIPSSACYQQTTTPSAVVDTSTHDQYLSATALLQRVAEMGATTSNTSHHHMATHTIVTSSSTSPPLLQPDMLMMSSFSNSSSSASDLIHQHQHQHQHHIGRETISEMTREYLLDVEGLSHPQKLNLLRLDTSRYCMRASAAFQESQQN